MAPVIYKMHRPRILVTGSSGYIGSNFIRRTQKLAKIKGLDMVEGEFTNWFSNPGYVLSLILALSSLWVFMGVEWKRKSSQIPEEFRHSHLPENFSGFTNPTTDISDGANIPIMEYEQASDNLPESWD